MTKIFDPETKQQAAGKTRALFIDGHTSHTTGTLQLEAQKRDILLIHLLSHSSHLIQPLDQQPFAVIKPAYARRLRVYDPEGTKPLSRAEFNILWAEARSLAFTNKNITTGWRQACLWPWAPDTLLNRRTVINHRAVTPDLLPEKTQEFRTPKRKGEWLPILRLLNQALPQDQRPHLLRIEHHLDELEAEVSLLRQQLKHYRKDDRAEEGKVVRRKMKKLEYSMLTGLKDVGRNQGGKEDEIEELAASQPSTFTVMDDEATRKRLKRAATFRHQV